MSTWLDSRAKQLLGIELPILLAPMAGAALAELGIAVAEAGGLGSIPCAMLASEQVRAEVRKYGKATTRPVNLNFFCHRPPKPDAEHERRWKDCLAEYYRELGLDPDGSQAVTNRMPFDAAMCDVLVELKPEVVSFHFGLPDKTLLDRVRAMGAKILSSATTVEEARWLEARGCDAIIAQGSEAGGHRGMFLTDDVATQVGTMALVPQIVDAVKVPVIAAGGIADGRGIAAAFALGASAVQLGTAYLFCPEATIKPVHRAALKRAADDGTALTNIFSGRPARGIVNRLVREVGPMSKLSPEFPMAGAAIAPLRAKSEAAGSEDFAQMWSGQAARLGKEMPAGELTRWLAKDAAARLKLLGRL